MSNLKHEQIVIEDGDKQHFILTLNETNDFISVDVLANEDFKKVILLYNGKNVMTQEEFNEIANRQEETMTETIKGIPRIKGSKIPISMILSFLQEGMNIHEISENIGVDVQAIQEAIQFAIDKLSK